MIVINAKIGTIPYGLMRVKSKQTMPKIHTWIKAIELHEYENGSRLWRDYYVNRIHKNPTYYFLGYEQPI